MAFKEIQLPNVGTIHIYKRRGARSIRLSITSTGVTRVTVPTWLPYQAGVEFARSRSDWIRQHQPEATSPLHSGQAIGKAHHVYFMSSSTNKISSRLVNNQIRIFYPEGLSPADDGVQTIAEKACLRALKQEASALLPKRLEALAAHHGYSYNTASIKQLRSRWGSCDTHKNIALNLFLIQLPWELIDYVLLHELTHTLYMHHGPDFWAAMANKEPRTPALRKMIKNYRPILKPRVIDQPVA